LDFLPADHPSLTPTYNNIGSVYLSQSDFNKAFEFQELALECQLKSDTPNPSSIIIYTNNLAKIYSHQGKHKEALEYHKRALEVQQKCLGENDPSLAETYELISAASIKLFDFEQAS
jgi:tetratricopeptide (TPR) repeat protein